MLKALRFAVVLCWAACGAASAAEFSDLVVGSLRDATGAPIAGAVVRALDAGNRLVGSDRSAPDGTFAVRLDAEAAALEVACAHCRLQHVALAGRTNVTVIVPRFAALENPAPDSADLAALPYGRIVDALALIPFVLPQNGGRGVADRALGGGDGLVLDDGAPLVDLATGESALIDYPDRYVRSVSLTGPEGAFRYGAYGGGGVFALDHLQSGGDQATIDSGAASALALQPDATLVHPALGVSNDDGVLARRADVDVASAFAGGFLRAGAAAGSERYSTYTSDDARNFETFRIAYATASRRYRTFADLSSSSATSYSDAARAPNYRASYFTSRLRLERPGPLTLAFGATANVETAGYPRPAYPGTKLGGRTSDVTLYAEASAGDARTSANVGLGLTDQLSSTSPQTGERGFALVPSVSARASLGGGAYARVGYSEALLGPTLLEAAAAPGGPAFSRTELSEGALGFDAGGGVRAEAIAFRQNADAYGAKSLSGVGASLAWQIAPLLSVRAWTLHDVPAPVAGGYGADEFSRQVAWLSYLNPGGVRTDAILHRDVASARPRTDLDADVLVPLGVPLALDLGTSRRNEVRRYYFGLRLR